MTEVRTPAEFAAEMAAIAAEFANDPEACHSEMDALMCATLAQLGYVQGVAEFITTPKWYA